MRNNYRTKAQQQSIKISQTAEQKHEKKIQGNKNSKGGNLRIAVPELLGWERLSSRWRNRERGKRRNGQRNPKSNRHVGPTTCTTAEQTKHHQTDPTNRKDPT